MLFRAVSVSGMDPSQQPLTEWAASSVPAPGVQANTHGYLAPQSRGGGVAITAGAAGVISSITHAAIAAISPWALA